MKNDIEKMLAGTAPKLRTEEGQVLWKRIENEIVPKAIPSPFFTVFTLGRMSVAAFALILILGVGGTTAAAQQSRPGDILFPVERALEEVRLALASNDTARTSLQLEFAEERLAELRSLIEETPKAIMTESTRSASSTVRFSGEADVFTDVTIVSVEIDDKKSSFLTESQTREEVAQEIARRYNISQSLVETGLDFEIENRASRVSDITHLNNNDERIDESMKLLSSLVDDIDDNERKRFVNEVLETLDFDSESRVEIRDDENDKRIEIRDDSERIRIREKDGEVRIDIKSDNDNYEEMGDSEDREDNERSDADDEKLDDDNKNDGADHDRDEINSNGNDSRDSSEDESEDTNEDREDNSTEDDEREDVSSIEVRVEDGSAEVRISYDNDDDRFTLPYVSHMALVSAISVKTGLAETIVEDNLEIEIKD